MSRLATVSEIVNQVPRSELKPALSVAKLMQILLLATHEGYCNTVWGSG